MGCNCKNQTNTQEKIVPKGVRPLQVIQVNSEEINYTREEIIRVRDYINARDKKEQERIFFYTFLLRTGGPNVPGYCDIVCMKDAVNHLDKLDKRLQNG